jgi:hypothetical protein
VFFASLILFHNIILACLPAAVVVLSISEYLFPIRYTLTKRGATLRCGLTWLEMPWSDVRHAYLTDEGVKLSPLRAKGSRMEPIRGIYLRFSTDNREAVIGAVRDLRQTGS